MHLPVVSVLDPGIFVFCEIWNSSKLAQPQECRVSWSPRLQDCFKIEHIEPPDRIGLYRDVIIVKSLLQHDDSN
jgi:hypothetical protein